jgi:flagellar hook-associated protein 3 FlgL
MSLRPTQAGTFTSVKQGLAMNLARLVRAQEQVASGRRITRASDDPSGATIAISLRRQLSQVEGYTRAIEDGRPVLDSGASRLQEASDLIAEARALTVQALNGTLNQVDRSLIADQIEAIADGLVAAGNAQYGDRYLFSGTAVGTQPFEVVGSGAERRVRYAGDSGSQQALVGRESRVDLGLPGDEAFGRSRYRATAYSGITGIQGGQQADWGQGYETLHLRTASVGGAMGEGVVLANSNRDTILGDHALTIDATAGTIQLGSGEAVEIPTPLPNELDLVDADGSVLVVDLSGWTGNDLAATATGAGEISLDGTTWTAFTGAETNLQLTDPGTGAVIHVDTTQVTRAGDETVVFQGANNVIDTLLGLAHELRNEQGLSTDQLNTQVNLRLAELTDGHDHVLRSLGQLGARHARLDQAENQLGELGVQLESLRSGIEDADLSEVVLEMTRAEQTLQVAQATGARLLQNSLLDFI